MPKYFYRGTSELQYGTLKVMPGDTIESSFCPSKNFVLVADPPPPVFTVEAPPKKKDTPTTTAQAQGE